MKIVRLHTEGKAESGIAASEITTKQINALCAEKFGDGSNEKQASETANAAEREWEYGDECEIIMDGKREQCVFGCLVYNDHSMAIVFIVNGHMTIPVCHLRKPETESERLERERLESAYDLYSFITGPAACEYNDFINPQSVDAAILADTLLEIVDKTNYRKESK